MSGRIHSFHLARVRPDVTARALVRPSARRSSVPGLRHVEPLAGMTLGSPALSPGRMRLTRLAVFAEWEDESALEAHLDSSPHLSAGWHVRLDFRRRWGSLRPLAHLPEVVVPTDPAEPVVAVTIARVRLPEVPRFVHWGRPVETYVRDHPGSTLALAAMRPPRTVSTFSVWRSAREMTDMVWGRGDAADVERHARAMLERERRDFHHEFTTLRFRPLSEHGTWEGRGDYTAGRPSSTGQA